MKELSIEEKAQAYDEVLNKLRRFMTQGVDPLITRADVKDFFPELQESEDERTRKEIVRFIQMEVEDEMVGNKWLAWLERQGEQILANSAKTCKDEQKPVDKVEPKFHQGEWIVFNGLVLFIEEVVQGYYRTISVGGIPNSYDWDIDNYAHLWTIQDAKDGDVLQLGRVTAIFQKYIADRNCRCYCSVYNGEFEIPSQDGADNSYGCHNAIPATKEQRDQLEKAMADARYTFDFEKKELRKIKDDVQLTEFEHELKIIMNAYRDAIGDNDVTIEEVKERAAYMLSLINPKPAWSEEDEEIKNFLIALVEWSKSYASSGVTAEEAKTVLNWLKSLKNRYTWKPSDEQIKALHELNLTGNISYARQGQVLIELYNDLKKLKGD